MNKIEKAREFFSELESGNKSCGEIAVRSFEIQSRLVSCRRH